MRASHGSYAQVVDFTLHPAAPTSSDNSNSEPDHDGLHVRADLHRINCGEYKAYIRGHTAKIRDLRSVASTAALKAGSARAFTKPARQPAEGVDSGSDGPLRRSRNLPSCSCVSEVLRIRGW